MLAGLTAFLISAAAAFLVYHSWRGARIAWVAATGWLLALGSIAVWCLALGPEFGASYAIIIFVGFIWIAVAFTRERRRPVEHADRRPFQALRWPGAHVCFQQGARFALSVPAGGVTAMLLSVALVLHLPWTLPLKLAVSIFLYPVLWGALSSWICVQEKLSKPLLVSAAMLVVSSLILFL